MAPASPFFRLAWLAMALWLTACAGWLPRCVGCDKPILGAFAFMTVDGQRYAFHRHHAPKACKFCGGVLAAKTRWGKPVRTKEGFDVCRACDKEAVRDLATAQKLLKQVRMDLTRMGIVIPWGAIPITLQAAQNPGEMAHCGAARYANGAVAALSIRFTPGMPRATFKGTAAHELTHAWAYTNRSPSVQDLVLSEGAPQVVEYLYLEKDKSPQARHQRQAMLTSDHPAYGAGMRRLKKYQEAHGLAGLLTVLRSGTRVPKGY